MSPHATYGPIESGAAYTVQTTPDYAAAKRSDQNLSDGLLGDQGTKWKSGGPSTITLQSAADEDVQDLLCVGFGPASLAIAVALHDRLVELSAENVPYVAPKVMFLERQAQFAWHSGMLLPSAKMQISFLKDLATLRNPRSHFTFINYLFQQDRLVQFTNLNTFLPSRLEFEDYLRWCARHFDGNGVKEGVVRYAEDVVEVRQSQLPVDSEHLVLRPMADQSRVSCFSVVSRNWKTGLVTTRRARNVVIAVGGTPKIPSIFPRQHTHIVHSSQFAYTKSKMLPDISKAYRIAVVGGGQSAAEIFENLHSTYPNSKTRLIIKGSALKPSDDSPFVNEIFDPSRVGPFYNNNEKSKRQINEQNKLTNYGVVRLELLERIYETLYMQRLSHGNDEAAWPHRILSNCDITSVQTDETSPVRIGMRLSSPADPGMEIETVEEFDAVVIATGYSRNAHEDMLAPLNHLKPESDAKAESNGETEDAKTWKVRRDYSVVFKETTVDADCGVWLQGCCENSHGLADTLLSILAVRGGELVDSIFNSHFAV